MQLILTVLTFLISQLSFAQSFDLQGHRGCRGLMPENTLPGFIKAVDLGVTTLEMDIVISKDKKCVVSHDPFFNAKFSIKPNGEPVLESEQDSLNLYQLDYSEIVQFNVGKNGNPDFLEQEKISIAKPLLKDVIIEVENHVRNSGLKKVNYNIEIKSSPEGDEKFTPLPKEFVKLVYFELLNLDVLDRVCIESFDVRALQEMKELDGSIKLSLLISNIDGVDKNLQRLGFTPEIYSPYFKLVNDSMIREIRRNGMKIIPWTVNESEDAERLKRLGVDGLITDFPDRIK